MLLLRNRDFGLLWTGSLVSFVGSWTLHIALAIHVYAETGSTLATGGVLIALVVPGILFGALGGVAADRYDRKRLLVAANVALAAATLSLLALEGGAVWVAFPALFLLSALGQLVPPAENALLPRLVTEPDLVEANALNALNNNLARLAGPVLGAATYGLAGIGGVVLVDAASFAFAAVCVALVRASGAVEHGDGEDVATEAVGAFRRTLREAREGVRAITERRTVSILFAVSAMAALGEGVFGTMFVVWVKDVLDGGVSHVGALMSGQAVGGIAGGLVAGWVGRRASAERLAGVTLVAFGLLDLALFNYPRYVDAFAVGVGLIVLVGIPAALSQAARSTILQRDVPDRLRGRVFGALGTVGAALMLAGAVLAGLVGGVLGPLVLLNVQGGAYVVAGVLVLALLGSAQHAPAVEPAYTESGP